MGSEMSGDMNPLEDFTNPQLQSLKGFYNKLLERNITEEWAGRIAIHYYMVQTELDRRGDE